jgi:sporulation protein YlmC with PRC-barrel domain
MFRLSNIYGRRIYSRDSDFIGTAKDVLIDPSEGKIKFLLREEAHSILSRDRTAAKRFIKDNFIPFERVEAVGDIIIVK